MLVGVRGLEFVRVHFLLLAQFRRVNIFHCVALIKHVLELPHVRAQGEVLLRRSLLPPVHESVNRFPLRPGQLDRTKLVFELGPRNLKLRLRLITLIFGIANIPN